MPTRSSSSAARRSAAPASIRMRFRSVSTIWSPTVNTGSRLALGSWKIDRDLEPTHRAELARTARPRSSRPREPDGARDDLARDRARARGSRAASSTCRNPDSPTSPSVRPGLQTEAHLVDREDHAAASRERDHEPGHLQQRPGRRAVAAATAPWPSVVRRLGAAHPVNRKSLPSRSAMPSPMRLKPTPASTIVRPENVEIHQAVRR